MGSSLLEIRSYDGEGYKPLVDYGQWRVAVLRSMEGLEPDSIDTMERHTNTDEVFVLLHGRALLIVGGDGSQVERTDAHVMVMGRIYNVKCSVWRTILLSPDASVLLVENNDTAAHNTEFSGLSQEHRRSILETAQRGQPI